MKPSNGPKLVSSRTSPPPWGIARVVSAGQLVIAVAFAALCWCAPARVDSADFAATEDRVPANASVPILFKLLTYDRTLGNSEGDTLRVAVLWKSSSEESVATAEEFAGALSDARHKTVGGAPFTFAKFDADELGWQDSVRHWQANVIYAAAGLEDQISDIARFSRNHRLLSLGATPGYIADGISVGLRLERRKPKILVNLQALRSEGHDLSARVLRLCEVVVAERDF